MHRFKSVAFLVVFQLAGSGAVIASSPPPTLGLAPPPDDEQLTVRLWKDGAIYYRRTQGAKGVFGPVDPDGPQPYAEDFWPRLRTAMDQWEETTHHRIRFVPCDNLDIAGEAQDNLAELHQRDPLDCDDVYQNGEGITPLTIDPRDNDFGSYGYRGDGDAGDAIDGVATTIMWGSGNNIADLTHELGHVIGMWHEQNRVDSMRWLTSIGRPKATCRLHSHCGDYPYSSPVEFGYVDSYCNQDRDWCEYGMWTDRTQTKYEWSFPTRLATKGQLKEPLLGNYDYDSIMHYGSKCNSVDCQWADAFGNQFERRDKAANPNGTPSMGDASRVLQYYAREAHSKWGLFQTLSRVDAFDGTARPDPSLDPNQGPLDTWAISTPAIAFQSEGDYDMFVRGNDDRLYWRKVRNGSLASSDWQPLVSSVCSDPAAVSWGPGRIDVVWVSCATGSVLRKGKRSDDKWYSSKYVVTGHPSGYSIKQTDGSYVGPAIASRGHGKLDVFAVVDDGRLASVSYNGGWDSEWRVHGIAGSYEIAAQPAALGLTFKKVQLALNVDGHTLHEPSMNYLVGKLRWNGIGEPAYAPLFDDSPATLGKRDSTSRPFRTLVVGADGLLVHHFANSSEFREIGGIPLPGTGAAVVATGAYSALIVMTGTDAVGADKNHVEGNTSYPTDWINVGAKIQSGGLWIREFR